MILEKSFPYRLKRRKEFEDNTFDPPPYLHNQGYNICLNDKNLRGHPGPPPIALKEPLSLPEPEVKEISQKRLRGWGVHPKIFNIFYLRGQGEVTSDVFKNTINFESFDVTKNDKSDQSVLFAS